MKRLHDISFRFTSIDEHNPDTICKVLTGSGFRPQLRSGIELAVRLLFLPAFDAELIVTVEKNSNQWTFSIHSARTSLWMLNRYGPHPWKMAKLYAGRILPPASWTAGGLLCDGDAPAALNDLDTYSALWDAVAGNICCDGCHVATCMVTPNRAYELRQKGNPNGTRAHTFCIAFLKSIRENCVDHDAVMLLDDVLAYFGVGDPSWRRRGPEESST